MQSGQDYYSDQGLVCPSFNTYTAESTADVAARVCREFKNLGLVDENQEFEYEGEIDDDDDFEFVSFQKSADEVIFFGDDTTRIGPVFPVFNRDLIISQPRDLADDVHAAAPTSTSSTSSTSDVDEMDGVPAGSYCVWMPKMSTTTPASSPSHCKKSKSTGSTATTCSSKRWRLRDLLRRSNSEGGKDSFVLLTPALTSPPSPAKKQEMVVAGKKSGVEGLTRRRNGPNAVSMAHEVFYAKSKDREKGNKRRSTYLPYRKDLVGFFASVNAMGRTFPTF